MKNQKSNILVGLIIAIIGMELIARLLGFGETVRVSLHDKIEYVLVENQEVTRFGNRIETNSLGQRSEEISALKGFNEKRIMLLGDSVVYGNHHVSQNETIAHFSRLALQETLKDQKISVLSAAASSWGPKNQLEYLKERGLYESDLVFLVLSTHDIFDFPTFNSSVIPYRVNKNIGAIDDLIYAVYNRAITWLTSKFPSESKNINFDAAKKKSKIIIEEIFTLIKNNDSDVILVFHPAEYQLKNKSLDVSFFENIAIDNDVKFINLKSRYNELNNTSDSKVHYDGMHLTPEGATLVASIVSDETLRFLESVAKNNLPN